MYSNTRSLVVSDVMSFPVITSRETDSIKVVAQKMSTHRVGGVVIVNKNNEPVGIITQGDIVKRLVTKGRRILFFSKAKHIMSKPVVSIDREMKIEHAAKFMVRSKIKRLCVVDKFNKLVGMVTDSDIMKNSGYLIDVLNEMINTGYVEEAGGGIALNQEGKK